MESEILPQLTGTNMFRIIGILIFLIVLVVGVHFSTVNSDPVPVNYFVGTATWPLSLVVVCAFFLGVIVTGIVSTCVVLPLRWRVAKLRRSVSSKETELGSLRNKIGQDLHQT
jgi:uncharacterized integral membrane protein